MLDRVPPGPSANKILEMVGPSGIGKSTLFSSLAGELEKDWFLPRHAATLSPSSRDHGTELTEAHRRLLAQRSIRLHRGSTDFWVIARKLPNGARVASLNVLMQRGFPRGFALDEGLFQCFARELLELDAAALRRLGAGRHLVVLNARDPDTVAGRAMARHEGRLARGYFQHPTTLDEQRQKAAEAMDRYAELARRARDCGIAILQLHAEDAPAENRRAVLAFSRGILAGSEGGDEAGP